MQCTSDNSSSLIYVTIKSQLPSLHSNSKYDFLLYNIARFIQSFTDPDRMNDETYCFFTHLQSAVAFIEMADASCLTIDPGEYNRFMGISDPAAANTSSQELMAHKRVSKKALLILGVDPSTSKVMKTFGIDEKTATSVSTAPQVPPKAYANWTNVNK